jgi:hypothetical protein
MRGVAYSSNILDLGERWRRVVSYGLLLLYPQGNNPQHPLDMRLGELQCRSGSFGMKKYILRLP